MHPRRFAFCLQHHLIVDMCSVCHRIGDGEVVGHLLVTYFSFCICVHEFLFQKEHFITLHLIDFRPSLKFIQFHSWPSEGLRSPPGVVPSTNIISIPSSPKSLIMYWTEPWPGETLVGPHLKFPARPQTLDNYSMRTVYFRQLYTHLRAVSSRLFP